MAWPSNPTNNQETTINGIVYRYDSAADVWQRVGMLGGDVSTDTFTTANLNVTDVASVGNLAVSHNVKSDLIPDTDVTYDLGSSSKRWKTLYLSGQTIDLGGTLISVAANGDISFGNVRFNSAGTINGSDITGAVSYATTANSVAGANVSGAVAYATTANSVTGGNVTGQVGNALVAGTVYTAAQPSITSVGTLTDLSVSGNATIGGNLTVNGTVTSINSTIVEIDDLAIVLANDASSSSQANGAGIIINGASANMLYINSSNSFTFSHKISADGGLLSNITGSNVTGAVSYATTANSVAGGNVSGAVSYATTANSVAVGNVSGIGNIATINKDGNAGNILYGNGVFAGAPNYVNTNVATFLASFGSNTITTTGNVTVGNIIGNGQALTGMNGANVTGTVATANNASYLGGTAAASYLLTTGSGSSLTNITGANITGTVATANNALYLGGTAAASYLLSTGTGSSLTAVTGANVTGQVANALVSGTVYTAAQTNITSLGTLTGLAVSGTAIFGLTSDKTTYVSASTSGTVTCDTSSTGPVWYYTAIAGATVLNFTNLPITDGYTTVVSVVFAGTAIVPTVQIAGVAQTIKWVSGSAPTGNASGINVYTFACMRVNSAWTAILGSYTYYA